MDSLLNEKEAAAYLGVSEPKLQELVAQKLVPAYKIAGAFLRFKKSEVEAIKDLLDDGKDSQNERVFHQAFSEVTGLERFKEILRANDVYLAIVGALILILLFVWFK